MDEFTSKLFAHLDKSREAQTILDTLDEVEVSLRDLIEAVPATASTDDVTGQAENALRTLHNTMYEVNRRIYLDELSA